jgi:hypothetical protein
MRKIIAFTGLFTAILFIVALTASADPRMEITDNFCHSILDPIDTDNEVFIAQCQAVITVGKKTENDNGPQEIPETGETNEDKIYCDGYTAKGYFKVHRKISELAAPIPAGQKIIFTSDDSETACYMVESNGREYRSRDWVSSIRVSRPNKRGMVWVVYELICLNGE